MSGFTPPPASAPDASEATARNYAVLAHIGTLANYVIGLGWVVPLVIMLTKGVELPSVRRAAVESLNFQISLGIYLIVSGILVLVVVGIFGLIALGIAGFVLPIVAASQVSNGLDYRYPLILRLVS